jgi:NitT/TauT family transport system ATP-binding protein
MKPRLVLSGVRKTFRTGGRTLVALDGIDLEVQPGEFVALLGPSGCGKTTLLRMIAGVDQPDAGEIRIEVGDPRRAHETPGMVRQDLALFPWFSVRDNVAFGLSVRGIPRRERAARVLRYLEPFGLAEFADYYPAQLSGGMQQRVALARTLINDPSVLLLDEPFGALDAQTRAEMHDFLQDVEEDRTTVLVTHDAREAAYLADRVLVLSRRPGRVVAEVHVDLPVPRRREMTYESDYLGCLATLEDLVLQRGRQIVAPQQAEVA